MVDIAPVTKRHHRTLYMQENELLKAKVAQLEDEVKFYQGQVKKLSSDSVPQQVRGWINEFDLPWENFRCYEHDEWFTELDSLFPFHTERCACDKC